MKNRKKKKIIQDTFFYTVANYIAQGIGIFNSVALRRFMGPESMGVWSVIQVLLGYCGYASFGTTKAMARDYPFLRGKREYVKARELRDMTLTFTMMMSIIPAIVLIVYLLLKWNFTQPAFRIGLAFLIGYLFIQRFYDLLVVLLRSDKRFYLLSRLTVINAVASLAITVFLVWKWNIYGMYAGTALATLGTIFYIYKVKPYRFSFFWNSHELWRELKLGVPLVTITFLASFLKSLDKLIIAKKLGFYDVGVYSIAMMVNSYIFSLPQMFIQVIYPNLQEEYGRKEDASGIKNYLLMPAYLLSVMVPVLCGLAAFVTPALAEIFLPQFTPGLTAMKISLVGTYFFLLGLMSRNFIVTFDEYNSNFPILIVSIGINAGFSLLFVHAGWGINGVAIATVLSFIFCGMMTYVIGMRYFATTVEIIKHITQLSLRLFYLFGAIFLIDHYIRVSQLYAEVAIKICLYMICVSPFLWQAEKKAGILRNLKEALLKKRKHPLLKKTANP